MHTGEYEPQGRATQTKKSTLGQWLCKVESAYGQSPTSFRDKVVKAWQDTKRNWPRKDTPERKALDGVFRNLCTNLKNTQQTAQAEQWHAANLHKELDTQLVCSANLPSGTQCSAQVSLSTGGSNGSVHGSAPAVEHSYCRPWQARSVT